MSRVSRHPSHHPSHLSLYRASMLDEAKRWFEAATVICRFVPGGKERADKVRVQTIHQMGRRSCPRFPKHTCICSLDIIRLSCHKPRPRRFCQLQVTTVLLNFFLAAHCNIVCFNSVPRCILDLFRLNVQMMINLGSSPCPLLNIN